MREDRWDDAEGERLGASRGRSNPLGVAGLVVALLGAGLFAGTILMVERMQGDERGPGSGDGLVLVGQVFVLGAGCAAGGVASLVGLGLSLAGLARRPLWPAAAGLALSLLGPALVLAWWSLVVQRRMAPPGKGPPPIALTVPADGLAVGR